jgi:hypothetical protein
VLSSYAMPTARGPGPVAWAHRLLIASALVCGLVFAAWEFAEYRRVGGAAPMAFGLLALAVSGALALYLRSLRGLGTKLTPRG